MAGNNVLQTVPDRGWLQGYTNLAGKESSAWWWTHMWLIQTLIWVAIINGLMVMVLFASQPSADEQALRADRIDNAMTLFLVMSGLAPTIGVVIIAQDAIIQEKQTGTAAWVLSKPISRAAFILSKLSANALGMLATMVLIPSALAYFMLWIASGQPISPANWLGGMGLIYLSLLFYLTLTLMLGAFFPQRGAVIGIPLALLFGYQFFMGIAPWVVEVLPHNLVLSIGQSRASLAGALIANQPLPSVLPLVTTVIWIVLFGALTVWRFGREEF